MVQCFFGAAPFIRNCFSLNVRSNNVAECDFQMKAMNSSHLNKVALIFFKKNKRYDAALSISWLTVLIELIDKTSLITNQL